jgi:hypothetical protein
MRDTVPSQEVTRVLGLPPLHNLGRPGLIGPARADYATARLVIDATATLAAEHESSGRPGILEQTQRQYASWLSLASWW